jgi:hypothetical protein
LEGECEEGPTYHINIVVEEEEESEQGNTSLENVIGSNCNESEVKEIVTMTFVPEKKTTSGKGGEWRIHSP